MSDHQNLLNYLSNALPNRPGLTSSEVGVAGSVNDMVNKQGIIDAYLAELGLLDDSLMDLDTSVIDANAAEAIAAQQAKGTILGDDYPFANQAMGTTEVTQETINDILGGAMAAREELMGGTDVPTREQELAVQSAVADLLTAAGTGVDQSTINPYSLEGDSLGRFVDRISVVDEVTSDAASSSSSSAADADAAAAAAAKQDALERATKVFNDAGGGEAGTEDRKSVV